MNKRALSMMEYALVLALASAVLVTMSTYIKRGLQGKLKDLTDNFISTEQVGEVGTGISTSRSHTDYHSSLQSDQFRGGGARMVLNETRDIHSRSYALDTQTFATDPFINAQAGNTTQSSSATSLLDYMRQGSLVSTNLEELRSERAELQAKSTFLGQQASFLQQEGGRMLEHAKEEFKKNQYLKEADRGFHWSRFAWGVLPGVAEAYASEYSAGNFSLEEANRLHLRAADIEGSGGEIERLDWEITKLTEEKEWRDRADSLITDAEKAEDEDNLQLATELRQQARALRAEQAKPKRQEFYLLHKARLNWEKALLQGWIAKYQAAAQEKKGLAEVVHYDVIERWFSVGSWGGWGPIYWEVVWESHDTGDCERRRRNLPDEGWYDWVFGSPGPYPPAPECAPPQGWSPHRLPESSASLNNLSQQLITQSQMDELGIQYLEERMNRTIERERQDAKYGLL